MKLRNLVVAGALLAVAAVPGFPQSDGDRTPKLQIDVFGFGMTLRENSLNKILEAQSERQGFYYNGYLSYLYSKSVLKSWTESVDSEWKGLSSTFPLGARVKYNISEHVMLSVGAEVVSSKATTDITGIYDRKYTDDTSDRLSYEFKPFQITVRGWAPLLGFHIYQPATENWSAEGAVFAGPLFGRVVAESAWIERGVVSDFNEAAPRLDPARTDQGSYRMEGTGLGFCLEAQAQLSYDFARNLGIFAAINVGYRTVPKLSGPGRAVRDGVTTEWDGEWGKRKTTVTRAWGTLTTEAPSNDWTTDPAAVRTGDFSLDLSGIWIGGGLFVRF